MRSCLLTKQTSWQFIFVDTSIIIEIVATERIRPISHIFPQTVEFIEIDLPIAIIVKHS